MPEHSLKHLMNVILFLLSVLMQVKHSTALARTMGRASRAAPSFPHTDPLHTSPLTWNVLPGCSHYPAATSAPPGTSWTAVSWFSLASGGFG